MKKNKKYFFYVTFFQKKRPNILEIVFKLFFITSYNHKQRQLYKNNINFV